MQILTIDELRRKQAEAWMASQQAVARRYGTYQAIKRLIDQINAGPLDVSEYYPVANRLGGLLNEIKAGFRDTIFHYYADQIDPAQKGDVRCFRMECDQLSEQLKELDRLRAQQHRLRLVKPRPGQSKVPGC
jgi:hypothetical protein